MAINRSSRHDKVKTQANNDMMTTVTNLQQRLLVSHQVVQQRLLVCAARHVASHEHVTTAAVAAAGVQQLAATGHYTQRCTHYMISFQSAMHAFHYVLELYQNSSKTVGN